MYRKIAIGIAILMASATASLAEDDEYARSGAYIGVAGSAAIYTDFGGSVNTDDPFGVNVRAGYRINPNIAAEVQYEWLSQADIDVSGTTFAKIDTWALTVNGKGYILTGRYQPFVVVGLGVMKVELEDTLGFIGSEGTFEDFVARMGGGIEVYITPNVVGNFDITYMLPASDVKDVDYVSFGLGLQYRF